MTDDRLDSLFVLREKFMHELSRVKKESYPEWPVDISDKKNQQLVRDTALKGVEEIFEAIMHFKNWKPHREDIQHEFDHDGFIEEIVDAFNYFLSVLVLLGYNSDDLYNAYLKKHVKICKRLTSGY